MPALVYASSASLEGWSPSASAPRSTSLSANSPVVLGLSGRAAMGGSGYLRIDRRGWTVEESNADPAARLTSPDRCLLVSRHADGGNGRGSTWSSQRACPGWVPRRPSRYWPGRARSKPRAGASSTWRSASPTSRRRRTSSRPASRRCGTARRTTARRPACRVLREACAARAVAHARPRSIPASRVLVTPGAQAVPVLRRARDLRPGRRGHLPRPRLPDLRVGHPLGRRDAGAAAAPRGGAASRSPPSSWPSG